MYDSSSRIVFQMDKPIPFYGLCQSHLFHELLFPTPNRKASFPSPDLYQPLAFQLLFECCAPMALRPLNQSSGGVCLWRRGPRPTEISLWRANGWEYYVCCSVLSHSDQFLFSFISEKVCEFRQLYKIIVIMVTFSFQIMWMQVILNSFLRPTILRYISSSMKIL